MSMTSKSILILIFLCSNFCSYGCMNITELAGQDPKIVGGWPAAKEDTKFQVSVQYGESHICGGAVISLTKVLTAAHCLYNIYAKPPYIHRAGVFRLVMGTINLEPLDSEALILSVREYVKHPDFSLEDLRNDIAIMLPHKRIPEFHPAIQPIPMVSFAMTPKTMCSINGWGSKVQDGNSVNRLLTAEIQIIKPEVCERIYPMKEGMLCAGLWSGERDSCQGDSGGPLSCKDFLVGIVSFGDGCGKRGKPGVYTDVMHYRQWILDNSSSRAEIFHPMTLILFVSCFICASRYNLNLLK